MYALSVLAPNEFYSFIVLFHIYDTVVVPDEWLIGIVKPFFIKIKVTQHNPKITD